MLADFDRDGRLDLLGPTGLSTGVGLWLGLGDGTFEPFPIGPADMRPWRAAGADLNGDGWLDLATVAVGDSTVSVRLGNGAPTSRFAEATTYRTHAPVLALLLADLDSDGHVDMVAAAAKSLTVWRGTASGTLAEPVDVSVGAAGPFLAAADWSQDGIPDLLYGTSNLRVMLGRGDGTFDAEIVCGVGLISGPLSTTLGTALADFDHDRKVDMVTGSRSVLLGMNGCNFTTLVSLPSYNVNVTGSVGVADLDGDGNADIASSFFMEGLKLAAILGDGRGGFTAPALLSSTTAYYDGHYVSGDLNNDGRLDVVVTQIGGFQAFLNTCP